MSKSHMLQYIWQVFLLMLFDDLMVGFFYYGAKCFNDLQVQVRGAQNSKEFLIYFENI